MNQVLEIIKKRHHNRSMPGKRTDEFKVALCVEGGGNRGVVGGGALSALEALGLRRAFDVVYGASSGAYSAAYFASGNTIVGAKFYLDYSEKQFISLKRLFRGNSLFDLDYVQTTMHGATPLDYQTVIRSKPPLHIVATDVVNNRSLILKNFKTAEDLDKALRASGTLPAYKNPRPLLFRHNKFVDAGIFDPFCIHSAIKEKCAHIMVLFTKPWKHRHVLKIVDRKLIAPYFAKVNENLAEAYLHHEEYSVNGLSHIWNHFDGTHIATIAPRTDKGLPSQVSKDRKKLSFGYLAGAQSVLNSFDVDDHTKKLIIESFKQELHIG